MKKGFTLIELLAVIIILAVIALIATPIILNVVNNAKESARKSSVTGYADAVKLARTEAQFNNLPFNDNDLSDLSIETNTNNVRCNEVKFDTTLGVILVECFVDDYDEYTYSYTGGIVTADLPDTNAPIVTTKVDTSDVTDSISSYFTFEQNGNKIITNIRCIEGDTEVTLESLLSVGSHTITCTATKANRLSHSATRTIVVNPRPNTPDLLDNMVPIKYVVDHWVYADISSKWYNYDNKEWANAVILNSGVTKNVGDEITENDIALWYVWIPRYKYTIFNGNNDAVNEQTINVEFESETATTGTVKCHDSLTTNNSSYSEICEDSTNHSIINGKSTYTHPAFCLGTKNNDGSCNGDELRGIWVGKFENSTTNSECLSSLAYSDASCNRTSTIIIKPNVPTWIYATLSRYFLSIRDISTTYGITNGDSHMMKNMEWGAVAYFKQSQYGLGITNVGVNNYHLTNNATNGYLFYKTGCGAEAGTANSAECNTYNTVNGMKASTTGNIYGVYDTNGGAGEMVMGNMISSSGGYNEGSSGLSGINAKYYDSYSYYYSTNQSYNPLQMHCRGKLGDATKETIKQFNTYTGAWYHIPQVENSGFSQFVGKYYWKINNKQSSSGDFMWLTRDNYPGNFGFVSCIGNVSEYASRSVLSKAN